MSNSHNERLEVFKAILDKVHGINAKTQRERLKQALIRLGNVTTLNVLLLTLNFNVLILETRGFYEKLNRRKSKGHDAQTSQPFKH